MLIAMNAPTDAPIERYLMSGEDVQSPLNIIRLYEALKGRTARPEEVAEVERVLAEHEHCTKPTGE